MEPGEYIEVLGQKGRVTDITWRHTTIVDSDGDEHIIPNSLMNKNSLVSIGESEDRRVPFLIPVETDLDAFTQEVVATLQNALEGSWARWGYACASTASNSAVLRAISWSMCSGML